MFLLAALTESYRLNNINMVSSNLSWELKDSCKTSRTILTILSIWEEEDWLTATIMGLSPFGTSKSRSK